MKLEMAKFRNVASKKPKDGRTGRKAAGRRAVECFRGPSSWQNLGEMVERRLGRVTSWGIGKAVRRMSIYFAPMTGYEVHFPAFHSFDMLTHLMGTGVPNLFL